MYVALYTACPGKSNGKEKQKAEYFPAFLKNIVIVFPFTKNSFFLGKLPSGYILSIWIFDYEYLLITMPPLGRRGKHI